MMNFSTYAFVSIFYFTCLFGCLVPNDHFWLPDIHEIHDEIISDIELSTSLIKIGAAQQEIYSREITGKRFAFSWCIKAEKTKTQPLTIDVSCNDLDLEIKLKRNKSLGPLMRPAVSGPLTMHRGTHCA